MLRMHAPAHLSQSLDLGFCVQGKQGLPKLFLTCPHPNPLQRRLLESVDDGGVAGSAVVSVSDQTGFPRRPLKPASRSCSPLLLSKVHPAHTLIEARNNAKNLSILFLVAVIDLNILQLRSLPQTACCKGHHFA